jgi:hypothetical protein
MDAHGEKCNDGDERDRMSYQFVNPCLLFVGRGLVLIPLLNVASSRDLVFS